MQGEITIDYEAEVDDIDEVVYRQGNVSSQIQLFQLVNGLEFQFITRIVVCK